MTAISHHVDCRVWVTSAIYNVFANMLSGFGNSMGMSAEVVAVTSKVISVNHRSIVSIL